MHHKRTVSLFQRGDIWLSIFLGDIAFWLPKPNIVCGKSNYPMTIVDVAQLLCPSRYVLFGKVRHSHEAT